jgi:uncharacterized protein (TIRG00374 family)
MHPHYEKILKYLVILITFLLLFLIFKDIDFQSVLKIFFSISLPLMVIAGMFALASALIRSLRWTYINELKLKNFIPYWKILNISYLGNLIFPGRTGELIRIIGLKKMMDRPIDFATISVLLDRLCDVSILIVFLLIVIWVGKPGDLGLNYQFLIFVAILGLCVLIIYFLKNQFYLIINYVSKHSSNFGNFLLNSSNTFFSITSQIKKPKNFIIVEFLTIFAFFSDFCLLWSLMIAFHWDLPFMAAITLGVVLLIGISVPSLPGYIGIYSIACVFALSFYGIGENQAVAFSIILHVISVLFSGTAGYLSFVLSDFSKGSLFSGESIFSPIQKMKE